MQLLLRCTSALPPWLLLECGRRRLHTVRGWVHVSSTIRLRARRMHNWVLRSRGLHQLLPRAKPHDDVERGRETRLVCADDLLIPGFEPTSLHNLPRRPVVP